MAPCARARSAISREAAGATSCTLVLSRSTTWSYPRSVGSAETCCSPISPDQYPAERSAWTMWRSGWVRR